MRHRFLRVFVSLCVVAVAVLLILRSRRQEMLVHAANRGEAGMLRAVLTLGADPASTATGTTALHGAAWHGRVAIATLLLDRGTPVDVREPDGVTPLMRAASAGQDEVVRLLLARGADVNAQAGCGRPLDLALLGRHASTAALLRAAGGTERRR